jgi:ribonuclease HII
MMFLKKWLRNNGEYPEFVRKSWKPAKKARSDNNTTQKTLV